jgi:hypothetical protein
LFVADLLLAEPEGFCEAAAPGVTLPAAPLAVVLAGVPGFAASTALDDGALAASFAGAAAEVFTAGSMS